MKRPTPKANSPVPPPLHPSPMAIVGAILAQGAIRLIDRQNREEAAAKKALDAANSHSSASPDNNTV